MRLIEDEQARYLRCGDETIEQLNERLTASEKLGRDLRAEMHRLQQRVVQTRTRIGKYKVSPHCIFHSFMSYCFFQFTVHYTGITRHFLDWGTVPQLFRTQVKNLLPSEAICGD